MIPRIRVVGLLAVVLLPPGMAAADGALAITENIVEDGIALGFSRHFPSGSSAQAAALDTCRKMSNTRPVVASCRIVGVITDQCFAIAVVPEAGSSSLGWAIDPDRQTAKRKALDACFAAGGDDKKCRIVESRCDGTTLANRCSGHAGASPDQRIDSCTALIQSGDESDTDLVADYVNRGNARADRQEFDDAIMDYSDALKRNPTHAVIFFNRGNAYRMKQDYDHAIADYDRAIALNPRYADAFINRGAAYAGKGDLDRAIAEYTVALLLDSADATAYRNRGNVYVDKGELSLAMDDYNEALRRAPADTGAYRGRGYLRFYLGEFVSAADDLARVVKAEPDDPYAMLWAYLAAARTDVGTATESLKRAASQASSAWPYPVVELFLGGRTVDATLSMARNPSERCEALFYGGEWKLLQGDRAAAVTALQAAVEICPKTFTEYKGAQAELKRLRE